MDYFIGIDIGTTSTKGLAITREGRALALERASYPTLSPRPGFQEQEPAALLEAVMKVLAGLARKLEKPPAALGLSCAMHSLIAAGEDGAPLTNAMLWSDRRSEKQADQLRNTDQGKALYRACGTPIHAMSPLCKLRWMREEAPDVFQRAKRFLSIKDHLLRQLCGEYLADISLASATGLMDIRKLQWHPPALEFAGIREKQLPLLASPTHLLTLNNVQLPALFQGVPVALGASDGCLANLGALALGPEELVLTIGTSGALRTTSRGPSIDAAKQLFNYRLDEEFFICGGPINNGGIAYQWLSELLGEERLSEEAAGRIPAGAAGLLFLPYLLGERAPIWNASASGAFIGMRRHHGPAHFHRAVLEGVAFSLYHIYESMATGAREITANGGFTNSPLWVQVISDVFGLPAAIDEQEETAARGAAYVAMKANGAIKEYGELLPLKKKGRVFKPDVGNHKVYQKVFERYLSLSAAGFYQNDAMRDKAGK